MVSPDPKLLSTALAHLVSPGSDIQVASPNGSCARIRVKMLANDRLVGSTPAGRVSEGSVVVSRVWANDRINQLCLEVEEVENTVLDRMDVLLRLVALQQLADRRAEPRYGCDQEAVVTRTSDAERGLRTRTAAMHVVEVSHHGIAIVGDPRYPDGEQLDVRFDDGTGGRINLRARVQRVAPPIYGRSRHGCAIVAISDIDARRLDNLVSRSRFAVQAPSDDAATLEDDDEPRRGIRGLLRRAG